MKCSNCNIEMTYFVEGQCCGWKCPMCGDALVTTYYTELEMDNTIYSVLVSADCDANASKIKAVSEVLGCNYLQAKEKIATGFSVSEVFASDAAKILKLIKEAGLSYQTTPEFPHEI